MCCFDLQLIVSRPSPFAFKFSPVQHRLAQVTLVKTGDVLSTLTTTHRRMPTSQTLLPAPWWNFFKIHVSELCIIRDSLSCAVVFGQWGDVEGRQDDARFKFKQGHFYEAFVAVVLWAICNYAAMLSTTKKCIVVLDMIFVYQTYSDFTLSKTETRQFSNVSGFYYNFNDLCVIVG